MVKTKDDEGALFFRDGIVYREWGYRLSSLERYPLAEMYFEKAIQQGQQNDLRTYVGLGKVQLNYARFRRALKTTEKCLKLDPTYSHVKHMQLQTLFYIGDFEHSLVHAHQGYQKYPTTFFQHGILRGNETIEDCIGLDTEPTTLELLSPWIRELQIYRELLIEKLKEEVDELAGIEEEQTKFKVNYPEARAEAEFRRMQRILAHLYLGCLAHDNEFLQHLAEHPEKLESPNKETSVLLHQVISRNYRRGIRRQNVLRMRRPLYVMMFESRRIPPGHKKILENEKKLRRNLIVIQADFLLHRLHEIRMRKDYITFFGMVDRVKDKFDSYSLKMFPLKERCLNALYNMVAWTYIDTRDLSKIQSRQLKRTYLKHHLGIRVAELPRDSDIGWLKATDRKETLKTYRRRLAMASEPLELAWLFHEFSKYLIDIRRYDLARFYGKKARDMGQEAGNEQWMLNSQHLFIRIEISQNYRNEAKEAALLALSSAKKLGLDFLIDFYRNAIEVIDDMDMEKLLAFDAIAARQQLILNLMPDDMKAEVDFLWRRMDAVPASRRLSVMPGCKPVDRKFKLPCKRMTILPSPPRDPEKEARKALLAQYESRKDRPSFADFDEYE
ncbi:outer dynein arm-docking complex subunit 4-like isoform X1 [Bombus pyrosoma]|uniref:outer dynein arm-docking complex subunit 4-like isoform X1 n=1 Tax=Bombus pyrosoma TaxID=396416 RepID=UPI001CB976C2|nr:outer dynein arm-docking complex subunit 4-like isoform X1 [Bombus pyrosoma]